jgi:hypothetical protein
MYRNVLTSVVVALCLAGGTRAAFAVPAPPSPLAKIGIGQIKACADSFEDWVDIVCPIFVDIVDGAYEISPHLGDFYAETYTDVVCDVADQKIIAVEAIAKTFSSILYSPTDKAYIYQAKVCAIGRILDAKYCCIDAIWGRKCGCGNPE